MRPGLALIPLLVFLALAGLLWARLGAGDASQLPSALIDHPAPPLPAAGLDGPSDVDLRGGRVTIVNIFGSWCAPCHEEQPALMALAKDADVKAGKINFVGVAQKDSPENIRRFLAADGNPYTRIVLDPNGRSGIDWGVYGVPETYVVRGDGTIAYKFIGPLTEETLKAVLLPQIRKAQG